MIQVELVTQCANKAKCDLKPQIKKKKLKSQNKI